ncbi:MAG: glycosyltransferase, partial [Actinomycetota bacterium]
VVPNGVPLNHFEANYAKRQGLLWLGRICEEKGPHLALDIASRSGWPIVMAGQVYPFSYHRQFFAREIEPRLRRNPNARWIDSPSAPLKCELLRSAAALLITSLVDETSSLVAMEAAACGTPVIAFRRGALPEVVKDGVTGFVVEGVSEALKALERLHTISPGECHANAFRYFTAGAMADGYERLYARLLSRHSRTLKIA